MTGRSEDYGLTGVRLATATDDSDQPVGTQIGADFGLCTQGGLTAAFGTLVGRIDTGELFPIGTNYNGVPASSGTLYLYCFDSNFEDDTERITADAEAVPKPGTMAALGLGVCNASPSPPLSSDRTQKKGWLP